MLYSEADLKVMFGMFGLTLRGWISKQQYTTIIEYSCIGIGGKNHRFTYSRAGTSGANRSPISMENRFLVIILD